MTMLRFTERFDSTVLPGDYISLNIGSVTIRATADVEECGWFYVTLSVLACGRVAEGSHGHIGGIDAESDGEHFSEIADELLAQVDLTDVALRLDEMSRAVRRARDSMLGMPVIPQ
jgi:hypothetical protein